MKKITSKLAISFASVLLPVVASAQGLSTAQSLVDAVGDIVNSLIPIAAGLALLGFFFGLAKYIFQAGNDEAQDEAKSIMVWGVIALFLIAAIGGIIEVLRTTLGIGDGSFNPTDYTIN